MKQIAAIENIDNVLLVILCTVLRRCKSIENYNATAGQRRTNIGAIRTVCKWVWV